MRQYFEPTDYAHLYREKNSGIYYARVDSRKGGRKTNTALSKDERIDRGYC